VLACIGVFLFFYSVREIMKLAKTPSIFHDAGQLKRDAIPLAATLVGLAGALIIVANLL
jgi:hypothetical protein